MPIYAYQCSDCGHAEDVLQRMSDAPLTACPACGKDTYVKQVTAAGFQLKGSGWYVTDFRDSGSKSRKQADNNADKGDKADSAKPDAAASAGASSSASASDTVAATTPAASAAPASPASGPSST